MHKELIKIRKQIAKLRKQEDKIILKLKASYSKEHDTIKIPGVTKTTWLKKPGELSRSQIYRRAKKLEQTK